MSRVTFYDPLYDFVTFEEAERDRQRDFFDAGFSTAPIVNTSKSLRQFLATPEFSRLAFLRQSDLGFLVYPSATHTRFAHAIGCCYLGYIAAREIIVGLRAGEVSGRTVTETRQIFLSKWLEERGWKEEFLLALLLHDVGHFAFSHALENNREFWSTIGGETSHEEVARQIIAGEGEVVDVIRRRYRDLNGYRFIADLVRDAPEIDSEITSYLICGDERAIEKRDMQTRSSLRMLHELTSGLLDLDRIDHYRRDSYFSGMKFASNLNFSSLLNGFTIWYSGDDSNMRHEIRLSKEAVGHALTLLHAKERLVHDCFENVDNLAYEVMLHHAFNYYVMGDDFYRLFGSSSLGEDRDRIRRFAFDTLLQTDEELLLNLERGTEKTRTVAHRIRNRRPYKCIGRRVLAHRRAVSIKGLRSSLMELSGVSSDEVLLRFGKNFGKSRENRPLEWLHLDSLSDENGSPLETHDEYKRQIEHFKKVQEDNGNVFWLFTPSEDPAVHERLRSALDEVAARPR